MLRLRAHTINTDLFLARQNWRKMIIYRKQKPKYAHLPATRSATSETGERTARIQLIGNIATLLISETPNFGPLLGNIVPESKTQHAYSDKNHKC